MTQSTKTNTNTIESELNSSSVKSSFNQRKTRRNILASVFTGAAASIIALPNAWTRPIVNSVVLPAHAQTTATVSFLVEIDNLTGGQPFSPPAVIAHANGFDVATIGGLASNDLELLAEGGDPSGVVSSAAMNTNVYQATSLGGPVTPGSTGTINLGFINQAEINVTVVTMLVVTNDGFAHITASGLESLNVGQSTTVSAMAYDAGTEVNDELLTNVPGTGGEGFNAANPGDAIAPHAGVTGAGGMTVPASAQFSGNVITITVTRTA